jgi:hypothetical protein
MSSALAVAAVTACLKDLLNDGLMDHDLSSIGSFSVTAQPPDRITTGQTENNQLNLFLYQVTPNLGWRNAGLPSRDVNGARLSNAPLALDLHYLLTAYGSQDLNAEVLLGYAMQVLHETPVLTRDQLRTALGAPSPVDGSFLPGPFGTQSAADLADQAELIKIAPVFLSSEDLSKLWTAMQARYRQSMAYMVSVVLIQREGGAKSPPPVLKRGPGDRGPDAQGVPAPVLNGVRHALSPLFPALRLGDNLLIAGINLDRPGALSVLLECPRLGISQELPPGTNRSATQLGAHLPNIAENAAGMSGWGVGTYNLSLRVTQPNQPVWTTNAVPVALAPLITVSPLTAKPGTVDLAVTCTPRLRPEQNAQVRLLFGNLEVKPASIDTPADTSKPSTLNFSIPNVVAGNYLVRLRVDGIDSLPVTTSGSPPVFDFDQQQQVKVQP